jgi:hypothetical protein
MNALTIDREGWTTAGDALLHDAIELRRAIHMEPELGLHLPKTTEKVLKALEGLPLEIRQGPSTTGVLAILRGSANGRTVLLRGDMDALPLTEDTGLDFTSRTAGAMHACGHDTHVAMLAGAAKALCAKKDQLAGTVMFMFQPGEEGHHGARFMLDDGLIDPLPDAAFALHISPNMPTGVFAGRHGPLLASSDSIRIKVIGAGGHASMPQDAIDPIPVACEIVTAMQTMVTRTISVFDPAVITIAHIEGGTTYNIIPEFASHARHGADPVGTHPRGDPRGHPQGRREHRRRPRLHRRGRDRKGLPGHRLLRPRGRSGRAGGPGPLWRQRLDDHEDADDGGGGLLLRPAEGPRPDGLPRRGADRRRRRLPHPAAPCTPTG